MTKHALLTKHARNTPLRQRKRLVKAELILALAVQAEAWAASVEDQPDSGTRPFDEWPDDDLFRGLVRRYDLRPKDLGAVLRELAAQLERRALNAGYDEAWL